MAAMSAPFGSVLGVLLWALKALVSSLLLSVAVLWYWHEVSALRPGRGVDVPEDLRGVNAIITGSTAGIGFDAALQLYEKGAHVLIHSSSQTRADASADAIRGLAETQGGKVTPAAADLGDFDQVVNFSKRLPSVMPRVHLLFLNAGKIYGLGAMYGDNRVAQLPDSYFVAKSGHDSCMAVNHLGHYLLVWLLLPLLAPSATIVVVSSAGAWSGSHLRIMPPWGYLGPHKFGGDARTSNSRRIFWEAKGVKKHANLGYLDSKYANICFARWMRRHLGSNFTVVLHDPGLVMSAPAMSRDSTEYSQRSYRNLEGSRQTWKWHAKTVDAGRHLVESAFVTRRPLPDWLTPYFFPEQVVGWVTSTWFEGRRNWLVTFSKLQKLTWGLHAGVGPECGPDLQDRFMAWSAEAIGLKRVLPVGFQ